MNLFAHRLILRTPAATVAVIALSLLATSSHAQSELWDFDTTPVGLNYYDPFPPFGPSATFTAPGSDGTLRVQNSQAPVLDGIFPGLGTARAGVYGNVSFTDFSASVDVVDLDPSLRQEAVLGARGQNVGLGTTSGYFAGFDYDPLFPLAGFAFIGRVDGEVVDILNGSLFSIDPTRDYRIGFQGIGSNFEVAIFDITGAPLQLTSFSATDSTYSSGIVGAFVLNVIGSTTPVDITFDNLAATAITVPEPSAAGLLALGMIGTVLAGKHTIVTRRRKSA